MNTLYPLFSHYYAIPFGIALLLPDRKPLAALAAMVGALALWINLENAAHAPAWLIALTFIGGLVSGGRARAMVLALPKRTRHAAVTVFAFLGGFVLLPGSRAAEVEHAAQTATVELRKWQMRPPAQACLARKYPVTISGATLYLPAAPIVTIRAGKISHHFQFNNELREICDGFRDASEPIHAENLNLDFSIPVHHTFCRTTTSNWGRMLCDRKTGIFPDMANIYSPEYDSQRLLASHSYADFVAESAKAKTEKHPLEPQQVGGFDRYANGYWVARGTWKNDAGEPYTLKCENAATAGVLSCTTSYRLKAGPQVTYHFSAPANRLESTAKTIDRNFRSLIEEVSAP